MNKEKLVQETWNFVKSYHNDDCGGHNFAHIKRVYDMAVDFVNNYPKADVFLVKMIALLHDVDDYKVKISKGLSIDSADVVGAFLESLDISEIYKNEILEGCKKIGFSSFAGDMAKERVEIQIVSDADKLEAFGAIGIARAAMYAGAKHLPLFQEQEFPYSLSIEEYRMENRAGNHLINHFFDKILRLEKMLQTPEGQNEANIRHKFSMKFLDEFFAEIKNPEWLKFWDKYKKSQKICSKKDKK